MKLPALVALASLTLALSACDPIGYGYVNQLHQPVAVVHHVHGHEERFTLASGERRLPAMGDWPGSREEFFDINGKQIAVITGPQIKRLEHRGTPSVLVLSPSGIALVTREYWDQWQEEVRSNARAR
jgi:hypothetical protein